MYPTAVLFHYIFYLFYKFWQIVRHKIFFKIREHILKEQQMLILCVKMFSVMLISEAITFCGLLAAA